MKISSTADRLKYIMNKRQLKQVDIVSLCQPYCEKYGVKMNKSDISQYVSGKIEPSQDKLVVLAMALNVQESWLMGFDVEMDKKKPAPGEGELSKKKRELLEVISDLSENEAAVLLASLKSILGKHE